MTDVDLAREAEETARNIDRLVTVGASLGARADRWIVPALYEAASAMLGGKPVSLVAAQALIEKVKPGDRVVLVDQFAYAPNMPYGETDGPPGVASLARALQFGLKAVPVIVTGPRDIGPAKAAVQAAGVNVVDDYDFALRFGSAVAAHFTFPVAGARESRDAAATLLARIRPAAIISVETIGPNRLGIRHSGAGFDAEAGDRLARLEELFLEASERGILSIAMMDRGNEIGSGLIEDAVRRVTPWAEVCRCPCGAGNACAVATDILFPASISNWGAYAIAAMLGYMLRRPEVLQDAETEYRVIEAAVMAGAIDGILGRTVISADAVDVKAQQALVTLLHAIVENGLKGL
ncbi:MAG: glutamate cyclase domain-containing protein [Chloroflexota bacterium]